MSILRRNPLHKAIYFGSKRLYALTGTIPVKRRTQHVVDGKPLVVIHNPKAAGSALKRMLGASETTHAMPRMAYSRRMCRGTFSVVAVRHPFDRFVSGYACMVVRKSGILRKVRREDIAGMGPFEFLDFIRQYPEKLGQQVNWTRYPDPEKPTPDLILKTEESADWPARLAAVGVMVDAPPRANVSREADKSYADILGLEGPDLARLEGAVFAEYEPDYAAHVYDREPPNW